MLPDPSGPKTRKGVKSTYILIVDKSNREVKVWGPSGEKGVGEK